MRPIWVMELTDFFGAAAAFTVLLKHSGEPGEAARCG